MFDTQERPFWIKSISETYILRQRITSSAETEKIGTWDATDIAKRRVKHHPFRHCLSRFFTSDDDLQCTLYSTLYSGRFQRKINFCESRLKVGTIPYRAHDIVRAGAQRTGSADHGTATGIMGPDRSASALQSSVSSCEGIVNCVCVCARSRLFFILFFYFFYFIFLTREHILNSYCMKEETDMREYS